jgi:hypothetical protein
MVSPEDESDCGRTSATNESSPPGLAIAALVFSSSSSIGDPTRAIQAITSNAPGNLESPLSAHIYSVFLDVEDFFDLIRAMEQSEAAISGSSDVGFKRTST